MNDEFREAVTAFIRSIAQRPIGGKKSGTAEEEIIIEARYCMDRIEPRWRKNHQG